MQVSLLMAGGNILMLEVEIEFQNYFRAGQVMSIPLSNADDSSISSWFLCSSMQAPGHRGRTGASRMGVHTREVRD
jgi:hypothetical protein